MKYDLEERLLTYAVNTYRLCSGLKYNALTSVYTRQLIKSSSSIGANYAEANSANSRKDFSAKISIALKEARESKYWLRLLSACIELDTRDLTDETNQIIKILHTIRKSSRQ